MFAGPFVEEIIFRKNIYTFIRNMAGVKCAVVFSALIFALYHCDIANFSEYGIQSDISSNNFAIFYGTLDYVEQSRQRHKIYYVLC